MTRDLLEMYVKKSGYAPMALSSDKMVDSTSTENFLKIKFEIYDQMIRKENDQQLRKTLSIFC